MGAPDIHPYDVVVVGAGGAGLRAAIEAHQAGARTAIVCKSLLGKAHTVMAEGGIAAAMGNVYPEDNWRVHFRDTMRGGKMLNNWRMAQLHAQESPDRVAELEEWGAVFDRTPDGRILQRDFGGHRYARLAHVGDRTGLEMIRTLQNRAVSLGIDVYMECTVLRLLTDGDRAVPAPAPVASSGEGAGPGRIAGALAYWRESGSFIAFHAPSVVLATGGIGKAYKVTSNSWEYTGDGHSLALWAGADLLDMEFVQFHPTGMVWPPSVKGILVTEGVRGDGGVLRNSEGRRFMFDYVPEIFAAETAETEEEADRWYTDKKGARRPPDLLPRDEVARAINAEVKAGPRIAARRRLPRHRLPPGPRLHPAAAAVDVPPVQGTGRRGHHEGADGGRPHRATTSWAASGCTRTPRRRRFPGLFAAGECAAGLHGSNRLGGNSLGDLLVFGRRAGRAAADYAASPSPTGGRPQIDQEQVAGVQREALAPFERADAPGAENPYRLQIDLQNVMHDLVGIIRTADELERALKELGELRERASRVAVEGHRQFNPGWHLAMDLRSLLTVSECIATAALARQESRGGHTRDDYPKPDPEFAGDQPRPAAARRQTPAVHRAAAAAARRAPGTDHFGRYAEPLPRSPAARPPAPEKRGISRWATTWP